MYEAVRLTGIGSVAPLIWTRLWRGCRGSAASGDAQHRAVPLPRGTTMAGTDLDDVLGASLFEDNLDTAGMRGNTASPSATSMR
jgi:hypothetical protein